jgi:imidazolonepropionase
MGTGITDCQRIWINANLATMDPSVVSPYGLLENYALGVKDEKIEAIVPMATVDLQGFQGEVINAGGANLTPGLIDSHTHLIWGGTRTHEYELRLRGASYEDIARSGGGILSTVTATRALEEDQLVAQSAPRLEALLKEGVTTIEIKSGYGLNISDELKMLRAAARLEGSWPVRVRKTLLAAHAVPPEFQNDTDSYIEMICKDLIPLAAAEGLADAVDVFCENIAFTVTQAEKIFEAARKAGLGIKAHAEQLSNSGGSELAARFSAWSADHLEYLDEAGILALRKSGTVATLLPGSFYFLGETQKPPVELLRRYQVPMALASDLNPGTSPFASLLLMMNMGCRLFGLTPEEALAGTTRVAARALGMDNRIGILKVGRDADMLLWDTDELALLSCQFGGIPLKQRIFKGEISHV